MEEYCIRKLNVVVEQHYRPPPRGLCGWQVSRDGKYGHIAYSIHTHSHLAGAEVEWHAAHRIAPGVLAPQIRVECDQLRLLRLGGTLRTQLVCLLEAEMVVEVLDVGREQRLVCLPATCIHIGAYTLVASSASYASLPHAYTLVRAHWSRAAPRTLPCTCATSTHMHIIYILIKL